MGASTAYASFHVNHQRDMGNPFSRGGYVNLKGHTQVAAVRFLPRGELVTAGDSSLRLWNEAGKVEKVWKFSNMVETCCCSPDGRYIACGVIDGLVFVFDVKSRQQIAHWQAHAACGQGPLLQFFADSTYLLSAAVFTCKIWHTRTTQLINTWDTTFITSLHISVDCTLLAVGSKTGVVTIHNLPDGNATRQVHAHRFEVWAVMFSPDKSQLATVSRDEPDSVKLWHTGSWELVQALRGHIGVVLDCSFSWDGSQLVTCGLDRTLRLWRFRGSINTDAGVSNQGGVGVSSASTPNRIGTVAAGGTLGTSIGSSVNGTWRCENVLLGHNDAVMSCAFLPDPKLGIVASGARDGGARAWRLADVPLTKPTDPGVPGSMPLAPLA